MTDWPAWATERVRLEAPVRDLADAVELQRQRAFRDALRGDAALRQEYAELKTHLASVHADDREACTEAKGDFIRRVSGD